MKDKRLVLVLGVLTAALIALLLIAAFNAGFRNGVTDQAAANVAASPTPSATTTGSDFFLFDIPPGGTVSGHEDIGWGRRALEIIFRLLLAVVLAAALAFRPRRDVPLFRRSLFVSQTQILLAMVAAALMMIVGDSAARAFGIFAAASLVRFRTNIRDPKEITVLLISLAIGLAAGVGRWELGLSLCLFSLGILWLLEHRETGMIYRAMELTIKTRDIERTVEVAKEIFRDLKLDAEVRELKPPDDKNPFASIVYYLSLRLNLTTDFINDRLLSADPENIAGIQWSKTKAGNIYP